MSSKFNYYYWFFIMKYQEVIFINRSRVGCAHHSNILVGRIQAIPFPPQVQTSTPSQRPIQVHRDHPGHIY